MGLIFGNITISWQKTGIIFLALIALAMVYLFFNPKEIPFFPPCPFKLLTGFECPGCGSQRAVHYLLNLNVSAAFYENALMVISIPYLLLGFFFDTFSIEGKTMNMLKQRLYGKTAIVTVLSIIIAYWVARNLI